MSDMDFWKGKIKPVNISLDKFCEKFNVKQDEINEMKDFILVNNQVFKIIKGEYLDPYGDVRVEKNVEEDYYEVTALWYNGGASLSEALS